MRTPDWHRNAEWTALPAIELGDRVELRFTNTFEYSLRAVVVSIDPKIDARVEALFAADVGQVVQGEVTSLVGHVVSCRAEFVHRVEKPKDFQWSTSR